MRFTKLLPVFAFAMTLGLGACAEEGAEEGEELTPADTAAMEMETPPPVIEEEPMMEDTLVDTMHQM